MDEMVTGAEIEHRGGELAGVGVASELPRPAIAILSHLPPDGLFLGNGRIRQATGIDPNLYRELTAALRDVGFVVTGRGLVIRAHVVTSNPRSACLRESKTRSHGTVPQLCMRND